MSIHSTLMTHAHAVLIAVQGDGGIRYYPAGKQSFEWPSAIVGGQRGGIEESGNGDLLKVTRLSVYGSTRELVTRGVTELSREAVVEVHGLKWAVDVTASSWNPEMVRLELIRRPIARHQELEDRHGAVR